MGFCSVPGCSNSTRNSKVSFHSFPLNNPSLLAKWIANIKRDKFKPNKHSRVCGEHFDKQCFVEDKSVFYPSMAPSRVRRLKDNAAPTVITFKPEPNTRINTTQRLQRQQVRSFTSWLAPKTCEISRPAIYDRISRLCLPVLCTSVQGVLQQ